MSAKSSGLGKGLDLIFMENNPENENIPVTLKISELEANKDQPRINFNDDSLKELASSIASHGLIQPIVVKPLASGKYKIIAGERRFRACKMAGVTEVPVIIKDINDAEIMELALIENLQRENLSAVEEAKGYKSLIDIYGFTQEKVSSSVGKSRSYVANTLRLLNLPKSVIERLENNEISVGHARTLLSLENEEDIERALMSVLNNGLNVRQLEQLVKNINSKANEEENSPKIKIQDKLIQKIESDLMSRLNRKVKILSGSNRKKNTVQIEFSDKDDLMAFYDSIVGGK